MSRDLGARCPGTLGRLTNHCEEAVKQLDQRLEDVRTYLENIVARKLEGMETGELKAICQVIRAEQQGVAAPASAVEDNIS